MTRILQKLIASLAFLTSQLSAIELPVGGTEISNHASLNAYASGKVGRAEKITRSNETPGGRPITVTTADSTKSYLAQCAVFCPTGALDPGDRALVIIRARVQGGEQGVLDAKLQLASEPYTEACRPTAIAITSNWTDYPVLFVVENALPEGKASLTLFCAQTLQTVEIASIRVIRYGPETDVAKFPRIRRSYGGRELDAPWRKAALDRIEKIRKADCSLTKLPLWVNEDQLLRPGPQSDNTWRYLQDLKQAGMQVDGLGNQAHIHESFLPSPEHVLAVTDRFAELVPRQSITEFDIQTIADEDLAADYTRDLMIACFNHPAYTSFLLWGFWEGSHWEPTAASWNKDWSVKKRGEVLEEWLGKRWRTEVELTTDSGRTVRWRGFTCWYEVNGGEGNKPPKMCRLTQTQPSASATLPTP